MSDTRKKYSREFKEQAVRMLEEGRKSGHEIEAELSIGTGQVYRWRKALEAEQPELAEPQSSLFDTDGMRVPMVFCGVVSTTVDTCLVQTSASAPESGE